MTVATTSGSVAQSSLINVHHSRGYSRLGGARDQLRSADPRLLEACAGSAIGMEQLPGQWDKLRQKREDSMPAIPPGPQRESISQKQSGQWRRTPGFLLRSSLWIAEQVGKDFD